MKLSVDVNDKVNEELWLLYLLAKNNEEILVALNEDNSFLELDQFKEKTYLILNSYNYEKRLPKFKSNDVKPLNEKIYKFRKLRFWDLLNQISDQDANIALGENSSVFPVKNIVSEFQK